MTASLVPLLSEFDNVNDQEYHNAFLRTHVPANGPAAYLHIIYKAPERSLLAECAQRLRIPREVVHFLQIQNGAHLFSGALYIYGVVRSGQMLDRTGAAPLPPFDIDSMNARADLCVPDSFLAVGGYGFDGSQACLDREKGQVCLFPRGCRTSTVSWISFEDWLVSEISRLSSVFDKRGERLVDESMTTPQEHVQ